MASVAFFDGDGNLLWHEERISKNSATQAVLEIAEIADQNGFSASQCELFCADLGPGSFTGVRVGIMIAKSFAFSCNAFCAGTNSFDLLLENQTQTVDLAIPSRKNEWWIRRSDKNLPEIERHREVSCKCMGWGFEDRANTYPLASNFQEFLGKLEPIKPELLVPMYFAEPSISTAKKPNLVLPR